MAGSPVFVSVERRLLPTIIGAVTAVVGMGTYLHYLQPNILRVPVESTPDYGAAVAPAAVVRGWRGGVPPGLTPDDQ